MCFILVLIRTVLNPIVMIAMLFMGYKAIGMVVVITAFNILTLIANTWFCLRKLNIKFSFGSIEQGFFKEALTP